MPRYSPSESSEVMVSVLAEYAPNIRMTAAPPGEATVGRVINISGYVEGTESGTLIKYWVVNPYMRIRKDGTVVAEGNGDGNGYFSFSYTVVSGDVGKSLTFVVEFVGGNYTINASVPADSEFPKFVTCLGMSKTYYTDVLAPTSIVDFDVAPKVTTPGTVVTATGKLVRSDTLAPLVGVLIDLWRRDGASVDVATATTLSDGTFSVGYTIPTPPAGVVYYYFKTIFWGGEVAGLRYMGSKSREIRLEAPPIPLWKALLIVFSVGAGVSGGVAAATRGE